MEATTIASQTETLITATEQLVQQEAVLRELSSLELGLVGGGAVAVSFY